MKLLTVRMDDDEYDALKARARAADVSISDYVRAMVTPPPEPRLARGAREAAVVNHEPRVKDREPASGHVHKGDSHIAGGGVVCKCGARKWPGGTWLLLV
jgi:hypothetical protein